MPDVPTIFTIPVPDAVYVAFNTATIAWERWAVAPLHPIRRDEFRIALAAAEAALNAFDSFAREQERTAGGSDGG